MGHLINPKQTKNTYLISYHIGVSLCFHLLSHPPLLFKDKYIVHIWHSFSEEEKTNYECCFVLLYADVIDLNNEPCNLCTVHTTMCHSRRLSVNVIVFSYFIMIANDIFILCYLYCLLSDGSLP